MEGWEKRGGGEEVGESHSPSTLGALSWNQSLSGWGGCVEGARSRVSLWHVAGSLGRLRSLGNRLKKATPIPLPRGLWDWRVASCMDNFSVPFAEDVLTLLVLVTDKVTHAPSPLRGEKTSAQTKACGVRKSPPCKNREPRLKGNEPSHQKPGLYFCLHLGVVTLLRSSALHFRYSLGTRGGNQSRDVGAERRREETDICWSSVPWSPGRQP